ncbi:unnamed protein product [Rotaria sp. Silwood1]|nr:unnamed protein product [Rotaria sp. Silwood1]
MPKRRQRPLTAPQLQSLSRNRTVTPSSPLLLQKPKPIRRPPSPQLPLKVTNIIIKDDEAIIEMQPTSHKPDYTTNDKKDKIEEDDIIYPEGINDYRPYKIIARYRRAVRRLAKTERQKVDFRREPLLVGEKETETLVLGLDSLAEGHGCELTFTNDDHQFDNSIYRAACGVVDLGSIHTYARSGFSKDKVLRHVIPGEYEYTWKPALKFLKLQPSDLAPEHNFDYRESGVIEEDTRGGYPYYLPIGWYRHALRVLDKYEKDPTWIGRTNAKGEWAVAYHGTNTNAVTGIIKHGLLVSAIKRDAMRDEAIEQGGEDAASPGVYVATHCEGGAYPQYTLPFTVTVSPSKFERFSLVFQCRVKPEKFTIHKAPVTTGEAWRFVDPNCVRPYGILLKKED